ncbi:MAG: DUF1565 domain-containing protein [Flavobacteriaceae bacterium]|nr:DUF1565 domain-containing protein [Flavobacteriaceae bacterium]
MKFFLYPFLFLISLNSFSSTYYVAPSASGGSNSNNGSISSPWETITYALTQLSAGDTLYLREGTYRETITITQDGSSGNVITYGYLCNQTRVRTKSTSEKTNYSLTPQFPQFQ